MKGLSCLIGTLAVLPWDRPAQETCHRIEAVLVEAWQEREQLMIALQEHIAELDLPSITRTAELHSWLLYDAGPWCVKLNQFMPSPHVGKRSENIHDHTRPLTSLTLAGGYEQQYFDENILRNSYRLGDSFRRDDLPSFPGPSTYPGMVYSVDVDTFHALTDFQDGTLSLCVYGVIAKSAIRVFNCVCGRVEERITCSFAKQKMLEQLRELQVERN